MNENRMMRVKHPEFGRGYVFIIAEDYFVVKFRFLKRREFPLTAFDDGTLTASKDTVKQFKKRHQALVERAAYERANPSEA